MGAAIGAAWMGERPVVELQFADFVTLRLRPDRHGRGEDALALGPGDPAHDPLPDGRRRARRPVPRGVARGLVRRSAGPQGRLPRDRRGRLRTAPRGDRRPRSGALLRAQALYRTLRAARPSRATGHRSDARAIARGNGRDRRHLRRRASRQRSQPSSGRRRRRGHRPAHGLAARRGDDPRRSIEKYLAGARPAGGGRARPARPASSSRLSRAGLRASRRPARRCTPRPTRRSRSRPSSRTPTCRRSTRPPRARAAACATEPMRRPAPSAVRRGRSRRAASASCCCSASSRSGRSRSIGRAGSPARSTTAAARRRRSRGGPRARPGRRRLPAEPRARTHFARGVTPADAFRNFFGKGDSPDAGPRRQHALRRPRERGVFPLVSMLGDLVPSPSAQRSRSSDAGSARVALTFLGEGAFSVGDTHEGLNLAGVWQVPAVFVLQREPVSTPLRSRARWSTRTSPSASTADGRSRASASTAPTRSPSFDAVGGGRACPSGPRPAGSRGGDAADPRPRSARRRALCPSRAARGATPTATPCAPDGATAARRPER